jgi:hypothetical protein
LEVHVEVKIEWLAVQVQLDQQIIIGLKKHGAVIEKDYTLEVR